jgi:hypothetical protein
LIKFAPIAVTLALATGATAADPVKEPTRLLEATSIWVVDASVVPDQAQIAKGKDILSLPLYPRDLIRINRDVEDVGTTGVKASAGKQFFGLKLANGKQIYCSTKTLDYLKDGGSIFYFRKSGTYLCLVDQDGDGRLDGNFEVLSRAGSGLPIISHGKDNGYENVEPIPFVKLDSRQFDNPFSLDVRWGSGNGTDGKAKFYLELKGAGSNYLPIEGSLAGPNSAVPGSVKLAGIEVDYKSPAQKLLDVAYVRLPGTPIVLSSGMEIRIGVTR